MSNKVSLGCLEISITTINTSKKPIKNKYSQKEFYNISQKEYNKDNSSKQAYKRINQQIMLLNNYYEKNSYDS